jgi:hypothetical protein
MKTLLEMLDHVKPKQNYTCVNGVIFAYLVDEVIWKYVETI